MKVRVSVSLKPGVLDPQGRAIHHALEGLGFKGVEDVRAGRMIELEVDAGVTDEQLDAMCRQLLANMVIENYRIEGSEHVFPRRRRHLSGLQLRPGHGGRAGGGLGRAGLARVAR